MIGLNHYSRGLMKIPCKLVSKRAWVSMQLKYLVVATLLLGVAACSRGIYSPALIPAQDITQTPVVAPIQEVATVTPTLDSPRLLSICLMNEPRSLFLYDAVSTSELNVLAAIYDG